ncbi:hypothetical protein [Haladaptatus sp. NG-SE-30]
MTLFEINLEKPALVEERVYADGDTAPDSAKGQTSETEQSESSGRSLGTLLKPVLGLLVVAGIGLLVRKRRASSGDETEDEPTEIETEDPVSESETADLEYENETEESSSRLARGRKAARAMGILGSILGLVVVARKVRGGSTNE